MSDDFEEGFEVGTIAEFEDWLASTGEGWLFLNSVDEARLCNPGDFERVVRKLGRRPRYKKSCRQKTSFLNAC